MKKTINDIKVGDKFCYVNYTEEFTEPIEIIEIQTCDREDDDEPMFTLVCKGLKTGSITTYAVQDETSDIAKHKFFFENEEEMGKAVYEYRKKKYIETLNNGLAQLEEYVRNFPLYEKYVDPKMETIRMMVNDLKSLTK